MTARLGEAAFLPERRCSLSEKVLRVPELSHGPGVCNSCGLLVCDLHAHVLICGGGGDQSKYEGIWVVLLGVGLMRDEDQLVYLRVGWVRGAVVLSVVQGEVGRTWVVDWCWQC